MAILWKNSLSNIIEHVYCNDRIIAILIKGTSEEFLVVNVYMLCDKQNENALDEFRSTVATLENILDDNQCNHVLISGDFNASPFNEKFWLDVFLCTFL